MFSAHDRTTGVLPKLADKFISPRPLEPPVMKITLPAKSNLSFRARNNSRNAGTAIIPKINFLLVFVTLALFVETCTETRH